MSWLTPGLSDWNFMRHLEIVSWNYRKPPSPDELKFYIAHINAKGAPDDWFFDSFLLAPGHTPSGNFLYNDINMGTTRNGGGDFFAVPSPNPGSIGDWTFWLDAVFSAGGFMDCMNESVGRVMDSMRCKPPFARNIVITIPHPHHGQAAFGKIKPGARHPLNFSVIGQNLAQASAQRLEAVSWFVDEALRRWKKGSWPHLNLLGFYWHYESLHYSWDVDDHWVIKELYKHVRHRKTRLFWIPFYSTYNVTILSNYKDFYFDGAFLQPNHMFYPWLKDVKTAARQAQDRNAGVEIEYYLNMHPEFGVGREKYLRLKNYLNTGAETGFMKDSACAYYLGSNELHQIAVHKNPKERQAYNDIFHFVKGDYEPR